MTVFRGATRVNSLASSKNANGAKLVHGEVKEAMREDNGGVGEGMKVNALWVPRYLLESPRTRVSILENGMRVATQTYGCRTVTVGMHIDAGSAYEDEENNGSAHFLEHMIFKGTSKRSQRQIEMEVENMGGQLNAYTSRENTVYYGKSMGEDVGVMTEILSDILQNSLLLSASMERERSVILTEKKSVETNYEEVVFDYLHSAAYNGSGLSRTILGEESHIRNIKRQDLVDYIQRHYTCDRMVISAAGAVKHEDMVDFVNRYLSKIPSTNLNYNFIEQKMKDVPFHPGHVLVKSEDVKEMFCALAYESVSWSDPDYFVFVILQSHLASWDMSFSGNYQSTLSKLVDTEKLASSYSTFHTCYNRTGLFGIYFITSNDTVNRFASILTNELKKMYFMSPDELLRAKCKAKCGYLGQIDGSTAISEDIGRQLLTLGRHMSQYEVFLRIDSVSLNDIQRVVFNHILGIDPVISAIGNVDEHKFPSFDSWAQRTAPNV